MSYTALLVIAAATTVRGVCPQGEPDNYALDNGCALVQTPVAASFTGGDVITAAWPISMFLGETYVNIRLVTRTSEAAEPRNSTNCRHGYYSAVIGDTAVLSQRVPNTGTFAWTAINAIYQEGSEYHLQISSLTNDFTCDPSTGVIAGVFATSPGFAMASMTTASWGWPNAASIDERIQLGGTETVVFHGLYHQRRYAYELKLMASIDGFNPATAVTHSWQVRMPHRNAQAISAWAEAHDHNLTAHPLETKDVPNWLGFRDELAGWEDVSQPINTAVSTSLQLEWQLPTDSQAYFKQGGNFFIKSRDDGTPIRLSDADVRLQLQIKLILHSAPGFTDDGTDCRRVAGACGSMEFGWFDTNANNVQDTTEGSTSSLDPPTPGHYASITDVLYENITMERPEQWAIWIGPAQQVDSSNVCSLLWPQDPLASCPVSPNYNLTNIVLRDITINSPKTSPGVLWGNLSNPMDITFDNVVVNSPGTDPFGDAYYACTGVRGNATATTKPVPPCFNGGPECVKDTTCQTHLKTPCCSGRSHFTAGCAPYYKCGCVAAGTCADTSAGCCSGKCHHTIDCGIGITCRCD